jgi:glycosyltransferase involved in cell wall biosynthesis
MYGPDDTWIVVAAFNEAAVIHGVIEELVGAKWRVVVVDDGSRDDTAAKARSAGAIVVRHPINRGQGAALQTGIDYAIRRGARAIVTFDADGQHDAADIPALLAALDDVDVVLGLRSATKVSNGLSGLKLTDAHCGLRAIRASATPHLRLAQDRMAHASELLRKIRVARLRVVEVPVTIRYTEHSMRKGQGGLQAVRILFDYFFRS